MDGLKLGCSTVIIVVVVLLFASFFGVSYHYFNAVWNARTPTELKKACTTDWYSNGSLSDLPAKCRQFYDQGIIEKK